MLVSVETALADFKAGKFVIIVDDEDRENEGDLAIAAELVTPEAVNFMATHGRGLICVAMTGAMLDRLHIPLMVPPTHNRSGFGTNFTLSVEARRGVTTGISAPDRAHTIRVLVDPHSTPADVVMPGHVFPLRARDGGVLERRGQTEASVDLARLAGLTPAGVICEVMREDGTMARLPDLMAFAETYGINIVTVEALAAYRRQQNGAGQAVGAALQVTQAVQAGQPAPVTRISTSRLPTRYGEFIASVYHDQQGKEHLALCMGEMTRGDAPLVRLHSECLTGDVLGSVRCDCGLQLQMAMQRIANAGRGVLLYLRQEGRGIGLGNKIHAYALQDTGMDTVEANCSLGFPPDARSYEVAAAMLHDLGVAHLRLMTNNPDKISGLEVYGIRVVERVPHEVVVPTEADHYMHVKAQKMGHLLHFPAPLSPGGAEVVELSPDATRNPELSEGYPYCCLRHDRPHRVAKTG
ncbi:MAG: GTP cyclohydrolase II [Chloroflexaceae bacterium]|nr:GTP cyclohydrolase II [Chloroflexaceae bacterium]